MKTTAGTGERIMQILDGTIKAVRRTLQLAPHQQPQNARILGIVIGALEEIGRTCLSQAHQARITELVNLVTKQDVPPETCKQGDYILMRGSRIFGRVITVDGDGVYLKPFNVPPIHFDAAHQYDVILKAGEAL